MSMIASVFFLRKSACLCHVIVSPSARMDREAMSYCCAWSLMAMRANQLWVSVSYGPYVWRHSSDNFCSSLSV